MMVLRHENGYGNVDLEEAKKVIDRVPGSRDRVTLRELLYDYERLRDVIDGKGVVFSHADGSETRRVKLY